MISRPGCAEHQDGKEHGRLAAGHDHDVAGIDRHAVAPVQVGRDGLAQLRDAVGRRVAVVAVADGLDGGFTDVRGRLEVRLADAEVDDILAGGGQCGGAGEHLEGGFGAETVETVGEVEHGRSPY